MSEHHVFKMFAKLSVLLLLLLFNSFERSGHQINRLFQIENFLHCSALVSKHLQLFTFSIVLFCCQQANQKVILFNVSGRGWFVELVLEWYSLCGTCFIPFHSDISEHSGQYSCLTGQQFNLHWLVVALYGFDILPLCSFLSRCSGSVSKVTVDQVN